MKKISILMVVMALLQLMLFANAAQNFSVSPISFTQSVNTSASANGQFTITNIGNESINLSLTKVNLVSGSNNITLNLGTTTITNFINQSSQNVSFTYTAGTIAGTYTGSITVANAENSSQNTTIPLTVTVLTTSPSGASLDLVNEGSTVTIYADLDERKTKTLRLENDGTVDLTNIQVTVSDLDGEDTRDEIDSSDIDVNDDGFDLEVGDSDTFEIEVDMPRNIDVDTYEGTITIRTTQGYTQEYTLKVIASGEDVEIILEDNQGDVRSGILTMVGEEGETIRDYEFVVSNDGDIDVNDLNFELDGALKEEFASGSTIPVSAVTFIPNSLDLDGGDDDIVEIRVVIPDGQASGNYFANIRVESNTGELYDTLRLKVKVIGDVYIKSINFKNNTLPGENLDINVIIKNQGSQLYRNVKITAVLFDVDSGSTDITQSSSTFMLDVAKEKTETLRFKIPDDATDGSHTLEIRVNYGDEELVEVDDITIARPAHNLVIESFAINPMQVSCDDSVYTYLKVKNLGKYDEDIKITSQISGTNKVQSTPMLDLGVDDVIQKNLVLNVEGLAPGDYKVVHKVIYSGNLFLSKDSTLRINPCTKDESGIIVKPINETETETETENSVDKVKIFGQEIEKTTAYLGVGVGTVFILIIFALFLL